MVSQPLSTKKQIFQKAMLSYWEESGRLNLPWRQTRDPWKMLIAEILLRKTTSKQAEPVYLQLADLSPQQLAEMDELVLQNILRPLGIHSVRAKQLRTIAQTVVTLGTDSLQSPEFLEQLPGVGQYIKNSVQCVAFGADKPGLDTNMIRVIQRVFAFEIRRSRAREDKDLWRFAEELVPSGFCREYNWAVLDFAAAVCKPRNPLCENCPVNSICFFYHTAAEEAADG